MIFKQYRDVLQYIEETEPFIPSLSKTKEYIKDSLQKGYSLREVRFTQGVDYSIDIYGSIEPVLGEMRDFKTLRTDNTGKEVLEHIVTFVCKRLSNGTFITPENKIFKIDISKGKDYQRVTVVELSKEA